MATKIKIKKNSVTYKDEQHRLPHNERPTTKHLGKNISRRTAAAIYTVHLLRSL